jgi:hypothetical protein
MTMRRRRVSRLLLESALLVASILLAFALNRWWEARQDRILADRALATFAQEITGNRDNLARVMPYHEGLHDLFAGLSAAGTIRTFEDVRELEGFDGFQPAFLTTTAWHSALATGAVVHMDYDIVRELSALYTFQARYTEYSDFRHLLAPGALAEANIAAALFSAEIYLIDVISGAQDLIAMYDRVLERLGTGAAAAGPAGAPGSGGRLGAPGVSAGPEVGPVNDAATPNRLRAGDRE